MIALEYNEGVINMLYEGRSRNMRHATRTMRIDIDWLFERIKTDKGIFLKYVNTKEQIADILTKGSFAAASWSCLIHLCCLGPLQKTAAGGDTPPGRKRQHEPSQPNRTQHQFRQHPNTER